MKTRPTTAFNNLALSYFSKAYRHYHILPESQCDSLKKVLDVLESAATRYIKKYGKVPVLFIDG